MPECQRTSCSKQAQKSEIFPESCLFRAVSLTKHVDIDQYKYSGSGIGFDRKGEFSFGNGFGRNCIIFRVDMSSSANVDKIF